MCLHAYARLNLAQYCQPDLHDLLRVDDSTACVVRFRTISQGAGPMPAIEEHRDLLAKKDCTGLRCLAHHALMFAKLSRVAMQLR